MEIRKLRETDDRRAVSRIYEESWKSAYQGIVPQTYLDRIPAGFWAVNLDQAGRETLVLTERKQFIGTSSVCPSRWKDYPDFGEVVSLYLLPEYTGCGYGGALLAAAVERLAEQGFREVLLWVLEENHRAKRFYEKHGFRPAGDYMRQEIEGKVLWEVLYCRSARE